MWNPGLDDLQAGIETARRNISKLRYADDTTLTEESEEPLDEHERGEWKSWLKTQHSKNEDHGIQAHQFMANRYGKMKTVTDFIFLGSKITADGYCSHQSLLLLGRKAMTKLHSILISRDITLPTKVHLVKGMLFPVVVYGCQSWTIKKAEHRRTDAFELWCWRRLLRVPWTARISNQSILNEIGPEYSLEGVMLKLKLQYFSHLMKNWLIEKDPDTGKDWRQEEKGSTEDELIG